jgi:thiamine phosphate synthase YjbQ (UPF0047 family)
MNDMTKCSDSELIEKIEYLKSQTHLGTWGEIQLSKLQSEATKRKIKL